MLSNHLQNGIETAKLVWSRLPNSEDGEVNEVGPSSKSDGSSVESLDYEVIENYAYREEQVLLYYNFSSNLSVSLDSTLCSVTSLGSIGAEREALRLVLRGGEMVLCTAYRHRYGDGFHIRSCFSLIFI